MRLLLGQGAGASTRALLASLLLVSLASLAAAQDAELPASPPERPAAEGTPPPEGELQPGDPPSGASAGKAGGGAVEFRFGYYDNGDDKTSGNPFLDESLTDLEGVVIVEYQATDALRLSLTGSYDLVSSASIERLSNYSEQSGASGDNYFGVDVGFSYALSEDARFGAHGGGSLEYDYQSFGFGLNGELDLLHDNVTLSGGLNAFFDQIDVIRFNGRNDGTDNRLSVTLNLGYYQVLSPTLHLTLGGAFTYQSGFLQTAYNGVVLEDPNTPVPAGTDPDAFLDFRRLPPGVSIEAEELPDTRIRAAIHGELRKAIPGWGSAIGFAARLYADSWGIVSAAPELRLYQWLVKDLLRARVRYRLYTQTAADAYSERFYVAQGGRSTNPLRPTSERTQDSDLRDFFSHTLGLKLTLTPTERVSIDAGADYVLRSDGIDQVLFSCGIRWEF